MPGIQRLQRRPVAVGERPRQIGVGALVDGRRNGHGSHCLPSVPRWLEADVQAGESSARGAGWQRWVRAVMGVLEVDDD